MDKCRRSPKPPSPICLSRKPTPTSTGYKDGLLGIVLFLRVKAGSEAPLPQSTGVCANMPRADFRRQVRESIFTLKPGDLVVLTLFRVLDLCERAAADLAAAETSPTSTSGVVSKDKGAHVVSWSGDADKSTPTFRISSDEWLIRWRAKPIDGRADGLFHLRVMSKTGGMVSSIQAPRHGGSDVHYVRAPAGDFYLEISSLYMTYVVDIEQ